jgi:hypothetical protein
MLAYKPALNDTLTRLRAFYSRSTPDRILAHFELYSPVLAEFGAPQQAAFCEYPEPEERAAFWDRLLMERARLEDDSIPAAYLSEFDQGLYGGLVGGEVRFLAHPENGWISSMVPPLLQDWRSFEGLRFDPEGPWAGRYRRQLDVFNQRAAGKFGISHFILIDGLNFVFELVGATHAYMSLFEEPEMVRAAIELAFEINHWVQRTFFDAVPLLDGGTCSNMAQWIPGRIISESVDPFHMTSLEYFEKWGRAPVQRSFDCFDGGVLHLHGNGRHLLETVTSLRNLKAVFLGDDRGYPPAHTRLADLRRRAGDLPLVTAIPLVEFVAGLENRTLTGGVFYNVAGPVEVDTANRLMERVRAY